MTPSDHTPPVPDHDDDESQDAQAAAEFGAMLEAFERARPGPAAPKAGSASGARKTDEGIRLGSRVRGRIVSISGDSLLLDVGGRSEAVADAREFRQDDGTLTIEVGQELELFVVEAGESLVLARAAKRGAGGAKGRVSLEAVKQSRAAEVPVRGKVTAVNTGGLSVDVDGVRAFCPLSQIDSAYVEDPAPFVGRVLEFLVTEVDESRQRVVVSRKRLLQREQAERAQARLASLAPGQELEGTVARLEPFGAFIDLGGLDGLIHVSELSHARVSHPRDVIAQGDRVKVKVLKVEPGKDGRPRIALSLKAASADPWTTAVAAFTPGARVSGVVVRLADFGAFVNLAPGVDGLVHVSQISHQRINHPRDVLAPGQAVEAVVLAVEPERRRIALSMREASEAPVPASRVTRTAPVEDDEPVAPRPPVVDDTPTPMQIALRKAREAAERRGRS